MSDQTPIAKSIFHDAIENHPPAHWSKFVVSRCGGNQSLCKQVMQLLEAHQQSFKLFDTNPARDFLPSASFIGETIGPYKLLEQIGEGGMGNVFLAQQFEPVTRRVAIKFIKLGLNSKQVLIRFESERQALAMMEHPNIAKFYDAGTTADGSPYFVMEFVSGLPLTIFCDEERLTINERLDLFRKICQAVQHAHQKGVIHRDLKPSNILVTRIDDKFVPKIIDFGLAKAIGPQLPDASMVTFIGQVIGTLQYMSPEQTISGNADIDTRSDIYSLGAILYELLVGCAPFDVNLLKQCAIDEVLQMIRKKVPPTPNKRFMSSQTVSEIASRRRIELDEMKRFIKGDLEWIVMRALEKEPSRRYQTADAFAEDILRYVEHRPVEARAPGLIYRSQKFIRRNRFAFTMASSALLMASIAIWFGIWMIKQTRNETIAKGLVKLLISAEIENVPQVIHELKPYKRWAFPRLNEIAKRSAEYSPPELRVALALLKDFPSKIDLIEHRILSCSASEIQLIRHVVNEQDVGFSCDLWKSLEDSSHSKELLNVASLLAFFQPDDERWNMVSGRIVEALFESDPLSTALYVKMLEPIKEHLCASLLSALKINSDSNYSDIQRNLAATIASNYYANRPDELSDFLLASQPSQFNILFDSLLAHQEFVVPKFREFLSKIPEGDWGDVAIEQEWQTPTGEIINQIAHAGGILEERFAYCANMPLSEFVILVEDLRSFGYRPTRCRPFLHGESVNVAAIWERDGRAWKLVVGQPIELLDEIDASMQKEGFLPLDATCYEDSAMEPKEHLAGIWVRRIDDSEKASVIFSTEINDDDWKELRQEKIVHSSHIVVNSNGNHRQCAILRPGYVGEWFHWYGRNQSQFAELKKQYRHLTHWDVHVKAVPRPEYNPLEQRIMKQLSVAESRLRSDPGNVEALRERANAHHFLKNDATAIRDFMEVFNEGGIDGVSLWHLVISEARLGHIDEARLLFEKYYDDACASASPSMRALFAAVVAVVVGEHDLAMIKLEQQIALNADDPVFLYDAACAYSLSAEFLCLSEPLKSKEDANRSIELLKLAVKYGWNDLPWLCEDPDFEFIRSSEGYLQIVSSLDFGSRIDCLWNFSDRFESESLYVQGIETHRDRSRDLIESGFRPVAISSVTLTKDAKVETASVWHRPLITNHNREELAKTQANSAIALARLGHFEYLYSHLKYKSDPRLRSWLIHLIPKCRVDPDILNSQLRLETDTGIRQALILVLGDFELSAETKTDFINLLVEYYEHDTDAGIHSAAEWALRRIEQSELIRNIDDRLLAVENPKRNWGVFCNGHTMTIIPGPVELNIERDPQWPNQEVAVDRSFAISQKETTVYQFQKFLDETNILTDASPSFGHSDKRPRDQVNWYDAAKYCRWLSEKDGIPESQMCFPPIAEIKEGMVLPQDYLRRTGYRLPTLAESELAARARCESRYFFGASYELFSDYGWGWYSASAYLGERGFQKRARENGGFQGTRIQFSDVASFKPNSLGLFDVYGSAFEWCMDEHHPNDRQNGFDSKSYPFQAHDNAPEIVTNGRRRCGHDFTTWALPPNTCLYQTGFRIARTVIESPN